MLVCLLAGSGPWTWGPFPRDAACGSVGDSARSLNAEADCGKIHFDLLDLLSGVMLECVSFVC